MSEALFDPSRLLKRDVTEAARMREPDSLLKRYEERETIAKTIQNEGDWLICVVQLLRLGRFVCCQKFATRRDDVLHMLPANVIAVFASRPSCAVKITLI